MTASTYFPLGMLRLAIYISPHIRLY